MNEIVGERSYGKTLQTRNKIIERIVELQKIGYERKLFYKIAEIEELRKLSTNDLNYVLNVTKQVVGESAIQQLI